MPSREKRARRRQGASRVLPVLIALTTLVAAVLVVMLIRSDPLAPDLPEQASVSYPENPQFEEQAGATAAALVISSPTAQLNPDPTPEPEATSTPEAQETQAPESTPGIVPTAMPSENMLPVYDRANRSPDDQAMIAITVDRCNNAEVMTRIVQIASRYDAKLTLFPSGVAVRTPGMTAAFRTCVTSLGYEIECTTYDHKAEYQLTDGELALQIWKQNIAVSYAMGVDYQQHFYRPFRPGANTDQRTHAFIAKLGMYGVGGYTYSYEGKTIDALVDTLANGNIYQFDMTEKSMALFETFISEASRKGYSLVTMNELFGYEANELSSVLTIETQELPTLDGYEWSYYDLKLNDRTCAVALVQKRLQELGYLDAKEDADGIYGGSTSIAVSAFQAKVGITATGNANVKTQEALFAADAPAA